MRVPTLPRLLAAVRRMAALPVAVAVALAGGLVGQRDAIDPSGPSLNAPAAGTLNTPAHLAAHEAMWGALAPRADAARARVGSDSCPTPKAPDARSQARTGRKDVQLRPAPLLGQAGASNGSCPGDADGEDDTQDDGGLDDAVISRHDAHRLVPQAVVVWRTPASPPNAAVQRPADVTRVPALRPPIAG